MIHLDWAVHTYEERKAKIERYDAHTANAGSKWRHFYVYEEDPHAKKRFEIFDLPEFDTVTRNLRGRFPELCIPEQSSEVNS